MKVLIFLTIFLIHSCNNDDSDSFAFPARTGCKLNTPGIATHKISPDIERIVTIIFENEGFAIAKETGYFKELLTKGSWFSNYFAIYRPSQPNYFVLTGASNFNHTSNSPVDIEQSNIVDLLEDKNLTWKTYAEDFPGNCYKGEISGTYARRHNPLISFRNISENPDRCANIVNAETFFDDWLDNKLPAYSLYIPNNINNGHDTDIQFAASWLRVKFEQFFNNPILMEKTLFIITFDEGALTEESRNNQILTIFLGPAVKENFEISSCYDHFSTIRTVEEILQLGTLGRGDQFAEVITQPWRE